MDLNERFNVLVQGVELAQKKGILSLENAVEAKNAIDTIQKGEKLKESLGSLAAMCEFAQKSGTYTLHDAHYIYEAIDGIDAEIDKFIENAKNTTATEERPEDDGILDEVPEDDEIPDEVPDDDEIPDEVPTKKPTKKKK